MAMPVVGDRSHAHSSHEAKVADLVLPKKEGTNINGLMGLYARHTTATACYCLLCCLSCTCATRCRVLALPPAPLPSHGPLSLSAPCRETRGFSTILLDRVT